MLRVQLIHWNAAEGRERAESLRAAGYEVSFEAQIGPGLRREMCDHPPAAVVIDLTRAPSQGRDVGLAIRQRKATRYVPLVFAGGDPDKVEGVRKILPDAVCAPWSRVRSALKRAIAHPPVDPAVPSLFAGYSGTPLPKKLGIKPNAVVALAGAPSGFRKTLGDLPAGVRLHQGTSSRADLILWFVRSRTDLQRGLQRMAALIGAGSLWIIWPKKTSTQAADLSQQYVRETGLAAGLVDYKICAVDATWSGLLFTRRRPGRS